MRLYPNVQTLSGDDLREYHQLLIDNLLVYINEVDAPGRFKTEFEAVQYFANLNSSFQPLTVVTELVPNSATIGSDAFTLHVMGKNFNESSVIVFNGYDEPTTYVSETEVTTGVNMPLWQAPVNVPVTVRTNDNVSNNVTFSFV